MCILCPRQKKTKQYTERDWAYIMTGNCIPEREMEQKEMTSPFKGTGKAGFVSPPQRLMIT